MSFINQVRSGPTDPKENRTFPTSSTSPTGSPPRKTQSSCRGTFFFPYYGSRSSGVPTASRQTGKSLGERAAEEPWREGRRGGWRDSALGLFPKIQLLDSSWNHHSWTHTTPTRAPRHSGVSLTQFSSSLLREVPDFYFLIIFF